MAYILGASTISRGFTGYILIILEAFGIHLPTYLNHDSLSKARGLIDLPSTLLVIALIGVILMGIRELARITKAMVAVKLPVILLVNGLGIFCIKASSGFDFVASTAEEAVNPQKDLAHRRLGLVGRLYR